MYAEVKTIITTKIDLTTFTPEHHLEIECDDPITEDAVIAAAIGACKSSVVSLEKRLATQAKPRRLPWKRKE